MQKILTNDKFSQNLKRIRKEKGLTQEQTVAKLQLLGSPISRSTYSLIEMGRGNIFISDLVGLQQILDVDFKEFFEGISIERNWQSCFFLQQPILVVHKSANKNTNKKALWKQSYLFSSLFSFISYLETTIFSKKWREKSEKIKVQKETTTFISKIVVSFWLPVLGLNQRHHD